MNRRSRPSYSSSRSLRHWLSRISSFVLSFFSHWLKELFDQNKLVYALVAWGLMAAQGLVLEVIAAALLKIVESRID